MPFLDLDGDGNIDPEEMAIGIALLDDEESGGGLPPGNNNNLGCGCLGPGCMTVTVAILLMSVIITIIFVI